MSKNTGQKLNLTNSEVSYDSRVVSVRRTTKVREGGRDFSFAVIAVVGDGNGMFGLGCGKAKEVVLAVQKAIDNARRNMYQIELKGDTLFHSLYAKYGASKVILMPGSTGTGIIAGGAMRPVFEVMGVRNVIAKSIGSRNPNNVIRATIKALLSMSTPNIIMEKRGKKLGNILGKSDYVD